MHRTLLVALGLSSLLTACASDNIDPRQSKLAPLQPGVTSYDQVVATLGQPNSELIYADQSRLVVYDYARLVTDPRSRVPALVLMRRDTDARIISAGLSFGTTGTLRYWVVDGAGSTVSK